MKVAKLLACTAIVISACGAIHRLCVVPYRCGVAKRRLEAHIAFVQASRSPTARIQTRQILSEAELCLLRMPGDLDLEMIAAASLRALGRPAEAIPVYRAALRRNRRPEIYWNLGQAYYEAGNPREGFEFMYRAASFAPFFLDDMEAQGDLHAALKAAIARRAQSIRSSR